MPPGMVGLMKETEESWFSRWRQEDIANLTPIHQALGLPGLLSLKMVVSYGMGQGQKIELRANGERCRVHRMDCNSDARD